MEKEHKNKLAYSELTDSIYWIGGNGSKKEITKNAINVFMLWLNEGSDLSDIGNGIQRILNFESGMKVKLSLQIEKPKVEQEDQRSVATMPNSSNADDKQKWQRPTPLEIIENMRNKNFHEEVILDEVEKELKRQVSAIKNLSNQGTEADQIKELKEENERLNRILDGRYKEQAEEHLKSLERKQLSSLKEEAERLKEFLIEIDRSLYIGEDLNDREILDFYISVTKTIKEEIKQLINHER